MDTYARTYIWAESARTVTMHFGADDGYIVWVNGVEVMADTDNCRCYSEDQSEVEISLNAGSNMILVKVGENDGHFGFVMQLKPATGLSATLEGSLSSPELNIATNIAYCGHKDSHVKNMIVADMADCDSAYTCVTANAVSGASYTQAMMVSGPEGISSVASHMYQDFQDCRYVINPPANQRAAVVFEHDYLSGRACRSNWPEDTCSMSIEWQCNCRYDWIRAYRGRRPYHRGSIRMPGSRMSRGGYRLCGTPMERIQLLTTSDPGGDTLYPYNLMLDFHTDWSIVRRGFKGDIYFFTPVTIVGLPDTITSCDNIGSFTVKIVDWTGAVMTDQTDYVSITVSRADSANSEVWLFDSNVDAVAGQAVFSQFAVCAHPGTINLRFESAGFRYDYPQTITVLENEADPVWRESEAPTNAPTKNPTAAPSPSPFNNARLSSSVTLAGMDASQWDVTSDQGKTMERMFATTVARCTATDESQIEITNAARRSQVVLSFQITIPGSTQAHANSIAAMLDSKLRDSTADGFLQQFVAAASSLGVDLSGVKVLAVGGVGVEINCNDEGDCKVEEVDDSSDSTAEQSDSLFFYIMIVAAAVALITSCALGVILWRRFCTVCSGSKIEEEYPEDEEVEALSPSMDPSMDKGLSPSIRNEINPLDGEFNPPTYSASPRANETTAAVSPANSPGVERSDNPLHLNKGRPREDIDRSDNRCENQCACFSCCWSKPSASPRKNETAGARMPRKTRNQASNRSPRNSPGVERSVNPQHFDKEMTGMDIERSVNPAHVQAVTDEEMAQTRSMWQRALGRFSQMFGDDAEAGPRSPTLDAEAGLGEGSPLSPKPSQSAWLENENAGGNDGHSFAVNDDDDAAMNGPTKEELIDAQL